MRCSSATRSTSGHRRRAVDGHRRELGDRFLLVGLVAETVHAVAPVGVVAHDAEEHHDRAAARRRRPGGGGVDRRAGLSVTAIQSAGGGRLHGAMVVKDRSSIALRPRRDLPEHPARPTRNGQGPSVHSAPCPRGGRRRRRARARRRAERPAAEPPRPPLGAPQRAQLVRRVPRSPPRETRPGSGPSGSAPPSRRCIATVLVLVAFGALGGRHRSPTPPPVVTDARDVVDYSVAERVGATVAPSVVTVPAPAATPPGSVGSGVVLKSDRVITAAHLLDRCDEGRDRRPRAASCSPAQVVGADAADRPRPARGRRTPTSSWPRSARRAPLRVGQTVVAVSATRGVHYRVGINVVSDRDVMVDAGTGIDVAGLLETGITVSPDMAGGALVDRDGTVVGILTYAAAPGAGGLADPGRRACATCEDQLDSGGKVGPRLAGRAGLEGRRRPGRRRRAGRLRVRPAARPRRPVSSPATWSYEPPATRRQRPARPGGGGAHACGPRTRSTSSTCGDGRTQHAHRHARRRRPAAARRRGRGRRWADRRPVRRNCPPRAGSARPMKA